MYFFFFWKSKQIQLIKLKVLLIVKTIEYTSWIYFLETKSAYEKKNNKEKSDINWGIIRENKEFKIKNHVTPKKGLYYGD